MDLERFERLLAAYGADSARWPDDERAAAEQLLARDPVARERAADAGELDHWLDGWVPAPPPSAARILAALPPQGTVDRLLAWILPGPSRGLWRPALAAGLTLALGMALGAGLPSFGDSVWESQERNLLFPSAAGETL